MWRCRKTTARLSQAIKNNTPGSTLWYAKLAFQREVIDQMQAMIDPQYREVRTALLTARLIEDGALGPAARDRLLVDLPMQSLMLSIAPRLRD
jgi:hypothetical protein